MTSARRSTLSHMNRLIAAATVAGTVACNKCNTIPGGGYAVVDPMPPPGRCPAAAYAMAATAKLVPSDGGGVLVEIELGGWTASGVDFERDDAGAMRALVSNGRLVSQTITPSGAIHFLLEPSATVGGLTLTLSATCDAGAVSIVMNASWGTAADGGKDVRVTLSEY